MNAFLSPPFFQSRIRCSSFQCRRRNSIDVTPTCCATSSHASEPLMPDIDYDDLRSDKDYVVLDNSEVAFLLDELDRRGNMSLDLNSISFEDEFLRLAEVHADEQKQPSKSSNVKKETEVGMQYFADENMEFMPRWLREAYQCGEHGAYEAGAESRVGEIESSSRRLRDIIERRMGESGEMVGVDGIVDCTIADVASDYTLPVEFIVDALVEFGVDRPVRVGQSVRDCMTSEEIERLLRLVSSFDAQDLGERYSDRCVRELADTYDLDLECLLDVCRSEGVELCLGADTRLAVIKEDRILDMMVKGKTFERPYPSALEGLE